MRLNRDLNADFRPQRFRYEARNGKRRSSRVRMALVSRLRSDRLHREQLLAVRR